MGTNRPYKDRNWLYQKYVIEKVSIYRMSKMLNVSECAITLWMRKFNIKIRSLSEAWKYRPPHSEETRQKMSRAMLGFRHTEETKRKISKALKGRIFSEDWKRKISESAKGRKAWNKSLPRSIETKQKISKTLTNKFVGARNPFYGRKHTLKTRKKISENHADFFGKNNPAWLGGKSFEPYGFEFNEKSKEQIRKRDNYICQVIGCKQKQNGKKFSVHHIDYDKKNNDPLNLITLCPEHHNKTNTDRKGWEEYLKEVMKNAGKTI